MNRIFIIGGGFAGLRALKCLAKSRGKSEIILIDKRSRFSFLPLLPDVLGGKIKPRSVSCKLSDIAKDLGCGFVNEEVLRVDLSSKKILTKSSDFDYDFLIISSGSETNFYGIQMAEEYGFSLDDSDDAAEILNRIKSGLHKVFVVAGGGYTGVEVASNMARCLRKHKRKERVILVERSPDILGALPAWMRDYATVNLRALGVEVFSGASIRYSDSRKVVLSTGHEFYKALLVWAAGVKSADFTSRLDVPKASQGRINVDKYLRISDSCFAAGDAACFNWKGKPLRMSVQFSLKQGECVARNLINTILKKPLLGYKPLDFGYIIPISGLRGCGEVLGLKVKGPIAIILHYFMCIYRSNPFANKIGIIRDLVASLGSSKGRKK